MTSHSLTDSSFYFFRQLEVFAENCGNKDDSTKANDYLISLELLTKSLNPEDRIKNDDIIQLGRLLHELSFPDSSQEIGIDFWTTDQWETFSSHFYSCATEASKMLVDEVKRLCEVQSVLCLIRPEIAELLGESRGFCEKVGVQKSTSSEELEIIYNEMKADNRTVTAVRQSCRQLLVGQYILLPDDFIPKVKSWMTMIKDESRGAGDDLAQLLHWLEIDGGIPVSLADRRKLVRVLRSADFYLSCVGAKLHGHAVALMKSIAIQGRHSTWDAYLLIERASKEQAAGNKRSSSSVSTTTAAPAQGTKRDLGTLRSPVTTEQVISLDSKNHQQVQSLGENASESDKRRCMTRQTGEAMDISLVFASDSEDEDL